MYKNPRGWNEGYQWQERRCPQEVTFGGCGHRAWWVDNRRSAGLVPVKQWFGFNPGGPHTPGAPTPLASLKVCEPAAVARRVLRGESSRWPSGQDVMRRECGTGQETSRRAWERGSRVPGTACWCSLCLVVRVSKGMRGGTRDGDTGPLRSFLGSGLAGSRPDARSTSTPPSLAWVSSTGK